MQTHREPDTCAYFLREMAGVYLLTKEANADELKKFYRTIELDPLLSKVVDLLAAPRLFLKGYATMANDATRFKDLLGEIPSGRPR